VSPIKADFAKRPGLPKWTEILFLKRKEKEFDYLDDDYVQVSYQSIGAREPFKALESH